MGAMTRTSPFLAALAVATSLALAAGGSNDDNNAAGGRNAEDKAFDGAVKFSRCMREHGLDFPDPQRSGNGAIRIGGGPGKGPRPDDAKVQAAQKDCQKYLQAGGGPPPDPAQQAKARDAFVQYARCMRPKGINMPDPKAGPGGGILVQAGPGKGGNGPRPDSPAFKAADKVCHGKLAAI